jgi:hypothetical protein
MAAEISHGNISSNLTFRSLLVMATLPPVVPEAFPRRHESGVRRGAKADAP